MQRQPIVGKLSEITSFKLTFLIAFAAQLLEIRVVGELLTLQNQF